MLLVNRLLDSVFDLLMRPLQRVGVVTGLAVVSLFTAIAILLVVRLTSDQRAMAAVKRQIHADLFEIRLFNDDLRAILRAELDILRHNATISACRWCRCCGCSFRRARDRAASVFFWLFRR